MEKQRGKLKAVDPFNFVDELYAGFCEKTQCLPVPDKNILLYQFTTAFPVGLALAQSWNTELVEKVGNADRRRNESIWSDVLAGAGAEYSSESIVRT